MLTLTPQRCLLTNSPIYLSGNIYKGLSKSPYKFSLNMYIFEGTGIKAIVQISGFFL